MLWTNYHLGSPVVLRMHLGMHESGALEPVLKLCEGKQSSVRKWAVSSCALNASSQGKQRAFIIRRERPRTIGIVTYLLTYNERLFVTALMASQHVFTNVYATRLRARTAKARQTAEKTANAIASAMSIEGVPVPSKPKRNRSTCQVIGLNIAAVWNHEGSPSSG